MRSVAVLILAPLCATLAGCGGGNAPAPGPTLNEEQAAIAERRAPDPEKVMAERWDSLFGNPAAVVAAANEFGYQVEAYKASGAAPAFRAQGREQTFPDKPSPISVKTGFAATGSAADRIDAVDFTFDVTVKSKPVNSKQSDILRIPTRVVGGFLSRFGVGPGDTIRGALARRESASVELHGVSIRVDAKPLPGSELSRALTVHIAPAQPKQTQPQGK